MQESINKLSTYFGFSIKSNAILFGIDNIVKSRKPAELIVLCSSANEKTIRTVQNKGSKVIQLKNILLSDLVKRDNVKVVAIKNSNLAKAIISFDDMFTELN